MGALPPGYPSNSDHWNGSFAALVATTTRGNPGMTDSTVLALVRLHQVHPQRHHGGVHVEVLPALPESLRLAAGQVLWEAFSEKMLNVLGRRNPAEVLARTMVPDHVMVAVEGTAHDSHVRVLGVAAVADDDGLPLDLGKDQLVAEFGPLLGRLRAFAGMFLQSKARSGELELSFIAVAPDARGSGVGQVLLDAVEARARSAGMLAVRLEVVNNNPRARSLYERYGYRHARRVNLPFLKPIMGFGGYDEMVLAILPTRRRDESPGIEI